MTDELIALLREIRPSYGDVGSRDVEVAVRQKQIDRAIELLSATQPAAGDREAVEEGCTPADARVLRAANHALADENDKLRHALAPFARLVSTHTLSWAMVEYSVKGDPEKQTFRRPQMQRAFNRAAEVYARVASPSANVAHPDDVAVDRFAAAMKEKLAAARAKGRSSWQQCSPFVLSEMLRAHVDKGDPRDVANFCMMLWNLDWSIAAPSAQTALSDAARDVLGERQRQMTAEGWTPEHDDEHEIGELARAAACYAANATGYRLQSRINIWPWDREWWKPTTPRRDLVKAGALILAEIERLDRRALTAAQSASGDTR